MAKKIAVIGAGFGGLSTAAYLARDGYEVDVFEKNNQPGGRAMVMHKKGFTFDMGPSWYMMPDVFEDFFADFNHKVSDFYTVKRLSPSYRVYGDDYYHDIKPVDEGGLDLFDDLQSGSAKKIEKLLLKTRKEYDRVRQGILEKDYLSALDTIDSKTMSFLVNPALYLSYHNRIRSVSSNPKIQQILEFMTVFMGGSPQNIPGIYSLLSHVDLNMGIWYPMGGFGVVSRAFESLCLSLGVKIHYNAPVSHIGTTQGRASSVQVNGATLPFDAIVANADYHHVETQLLRHNFQSYKDKYWEKKTLSPSALLVYLGVKNKVPGLQHHTMFFDADWQGHFNQVFHEGAWSDNPLFYVSTPSKTDAKIAPKGQENMVILAPMANNLYPTKKQKDTLVQTILHRLERHTGHLIQQDIITKDIRDASFFTHTFNAYKGNSFGLAHTLTQSAVFRPRMQSRKLHNLVYVGQYTNPGTGVPMVVLSGKIAARVIHERALA